ncbi:MAG TPA: PQQ-binding-like beta-propeller repeat protein [Bryobacteraceae bacterium]
MKRSPKLWMCLAIALGVVVVTLSWNRPRLILAQSKTEPYAAWSDYAGSMDSSQYSALKQINKSNVKQLEQVWFYPAPGPSNRFAFSPLIVDGVMYVLKPDPMLVALDATSGREIWRHPVEGTPGDRGINYWESKDRKDRRLLFAANSYLQEVNALTGITINTFGNDGRVDLRVGLNRDTKTIPNVQTGTPGRVFDNLIILGSAVSESFGAPPGYLRSYDVVTGKMVWNFHTIPLPGEYGYATWPKDTWKWAGGVNTWGEFSIDEKRGIAYFPLGSPTSDFYGADRVGQDLFGDCLLALDVRTGKRLWHFQEVHHDLWDYDPTASPKLVTVRHNGKMVDAVAQAGKTGFLYVFDRVSGEPLWPIEERRVPQSKVPGEQSWPTQPFPTRPPPFARQKFDIADINPYLDEAEKTRIREILLNSDNHGIFTPAGLERDSIQIPGDDGGANWSNTAADPQAGMVYVRSGDGANLKRIRTQPARPNFVGGTPAQEGNVIYMQRCQVCHGPDRNGVADPKAVGADRFKAIVSKGEGGQMPAFSDLSEAQLDALVAFISNPEAGALPAGRGGAGRGNPGALSGGGGMGDRMPYPKGIPRYFGAYGGRIVSLSNNLPASAPPWTTLTAYDLNEGTIKWQVPLGTVPFLAAKGIRNTGTVKVGLLANHVGPVVTAGGLIFISSWADGVIHAFDKDTGEELWEKELDVNPEGIPAVYEVAGREYLAFLGTGRPTGGGGRGSGEGITWKPGKPEAQGYYVFALPDQAPGK